VIEQYGKEHHYDIILSQGSGAVYTVDKYDVTKGMTAALDADWAKQQKSQSTQKKSSGSGK